MQEMAGTEETASSSLHLHVGIRSFAQLLSHLVLVFQLGLLRPGVPHQNLVANSVLN